MKILIIHGPNLNMLGKREPGTYGSATLEDINRSLRNLGEELDAHVDIMQSNDEATLIDTVHGALDKRIDGIVINPGAYTHTSIALRDALLAVNLPFIEVHISNTFARESFRHQSYLSDVAAGVIIGLGPVGYLFGMRALAQMLQVRHIAQSTEGVGEKPAPVSE
jgi:3-dehydroquinate dehydratase-2